MTAVWFCSTVIVRLKFWEILLWWSFDFLGWNLVVHLIKRDAFSFILIENHYCHNAADPRLSTRQCRVRQKSDEFEYPADGNVIVVLAKRRTFAVGQRVEWLVTIFHAVENIQLSFESAWDSQVEAKSDWAVRRLQKSTSKISTSLQESSESQEAHFKQLQCAPNLLTWECLVRVAVQVISDL